MTALGFIGLGVMGEPMCRNLAAKAGAPVVGCDVRREPLERLAAHGVVAAASPAEVARRAELIFLSLPGGDELAEVCAGRHGLLAGVRAGHTVVDCTTAPVALTRDLAARFAEAGVDYADAPVARTRAAAEAGTLAVMVGASARTFARLRPYLAHFAADISHCGEVGAGQVAKLMNNMVLFQTVVALAEALCVARRAGVDGARLFATLATGSADSFALRNHGIKALLPGEFPERAFSARYALKDLAYALELAAEGGVRVAGAQVARRALEAAVARGDGERYFPVLLEAIESAGA